MRPFGQMIRGARGSLASQGITLAQLLFQLVVTIVGVYIAIVLQDTADQRSHARAADHTLHAIEAELAADEENLGRIIEAQREQSLRLMDLARAVRDASTTDTTLYRLIVFESAPNRTFFSRSAAYATLVSTGQLEHVNDETLRLALAHIYEHDYDRLRLNGELSDAVWQNVFRQAQLDYWDYETRRRIPGDAQSAIGVSNAAHRVAVFSRNYVDIMETTRERVRSTRALVAAYLAER